MPIPESHENVLFQILKARDRVTMSPFWPWTTRLPTTSPSSTPARYIPAP